MIVTQWALNQKSFLQIIMSPKLRPYVDSGDDNWVGCEL